jgi:hypothetical protein
MNELADRLAKRAIRDVDSGKADIADFGLQFYHNAPPYALGQKLSEQTRISLSRASTAVSFFLAKALRLWGHSPRKTPKHPWDCTSIGFVPLLPSTS